MQKSGKKLLSNGMAGAGVAAMVAALVGVTGAGTSAADQSLTLNYTCPFPLIGDQDLSVKIGVGIPEKIVQGQKTPDIPITADVTVPSAAVDGLNLVSAKTVEGSAIANAAIKIGSTNLPLKPNLTVPKTDVPASGSMVVHSTGKTPGIAPPSAGDGSVTIGDFTTTLEPKQADGSDTGLGKFDSACKLKPGQNAVIKFTVTPSGDTPPSTDPTDPPSNPPSDPTDPPSDPTSPPTTPPTAGTHLDFGVQGSTHVKALGADVPVGPGKLGFDIDLQSGKFAGDLSLPTANKASFNILGFIPGTTTVQVVPVGQTTGTFQNNTVNSDSKVSVKLNEVTVFGGIPLVTATDKCQTSSDADIALKSGPDFNLKDGGKLTGTYTLPKLQGCGGLNDYISAFAAGDGNTISLDVKPSAATDD